jgi:hypothetical protein
MQNQPRTLASITLALASAPLAEAHADTVTIFDGNVNSWMTTANTSSTKGAVTPIGPSSTPLVPTASGGLNFRIA